ncbi:Phage tail assembly chaperone protein, TAC [Desulfotomaculum arcticum]|uniref:Phage tail assembly chaperone protein, TAC n=1 Tax=Desulfotruncus arcticus DSM 17038 TaxID=1121424 RepID=A0A1I2YEP2_9FIRM|nr:phage tail assembly chaperone [Desulfotruncus arcticus]SFH22951.1 Phage tail assembly chaperone protein, TAC [Desulfotomaculum arcticum] [Desulfotruncus arcticus DSM 17038]
MEAGWGELKMLAFGPLQLKPAEFWELTITEFAEMLEAYTEFKHQTEEATYHRTAWLAANLMNATGNYRTLITPEKLLGKTQTAAAKPITSEERDIQFQELLKKFNKA